MRRLWILCVALVLLSGCSNHSSHSSSAQDAASKRAFVQQLVGYCAQVDRQMTSIDEKSQPGQIAHQLQRFTSQARSHPPPSAQHQQLDILLTAIDDAVQQYQSAQAALSSGNGNAYHAKLKQAEQTMQNASLAAVRYGMPPLADCAKVAGGPQQNTPAQPARGWQLGRIRCTRSSRLVRRCWMAGSGWPAA